MQNQLDYLSQFESDVQAICQPLLDKKINFFSYLRYHQDGRIKLLSTSAKLYKHFIKKQYLLTTPIPRALLKREMHYLVQAEGVYQEAMHDTYSILETKNMIDLIQFGDGYYDMFCYSGNVSNNCLLSMVDQLQLFAMHFKDKARPMLTGNKLLLPKAMRVNLIEDYASKDRVVTKELVTVEKYYFEIDGRELYFTQREMQCWLLLSAGFEYKQIANHLEISARTVETHVTKLKLKLNIYRKIDLVRQAHCLPHYHALLKQFIAA